MTGGFFMAMWTKIIGNSTVFVSHSGEIFSE